MPVKNLEAELARCNEKLLRMKGKEGRRSSPSRNKIERKSTKKSFEKTYSNRLPTSPSAI